MRILVYVLLSIGFALASYSERHFECGTQQIAHKKKANNTKTLPHSLRDFERFTPTECQETLCDDPQISLGYANAVATNNLASHIIPSAIYVLAFDNGTSPLVSKDSVQEQVDMLNNTTRGFRLSFAHQLILVKMTSLRVGVVMFYECDPKQIGNNVTDQECFAEETGWDGGDFLCDETAENKNCTLSEYLQPSDPLKACSCIYIDTSSCKNSMIGNGICNESCNYKKHNWDGGDCCIHTDRNLCRDQSKPINKRNWAGAHELKNYLKLNHTASMNTIVASTPESNNIIVGGVSYYPWGTVEGESSKGGITMNKNLWGTNNAYLNKGSSWIHEVGHAFGLYHTFKGVSETNKTFCKDACQENNYQTDSVRMTVGDLCSDTAPTPVNYECNDPPPCSKDASDPSCGDCLGKPWKNTGLTNYMGYTPDVGACAAKIFSTQQKARMRCYLDFLKSSWLNDERPSQIVTKPTIAGLSDGRFSIAWEPPVRAGEGLEYDIQKLYGSSSEMLQTKNTYINDDSSSLAHVSYRVRAKNKYGACDTWSPMVTWNRKSAKSFNPTAYIVMGAVVGFVMVVILIVTIKVRSLGRRLKSSHVNHHEAYDE